MSRLKLLPNHQYIDRGKSGYRGNKQKALDALLQKLADGSLPPQSTMITEHVDRLSKKGIDRTRAVVSSILQHEINIMIVVPMPRIFYAADREHDMGGTIELVTFAYSAGFCSKNLSDRIIAKNEDRRRRKREGETVLLASVIPSWLIHQGDGKSKVKPGATKTIKHIFKRINSDGIGCNAVQKELNAKAEKFRPIGRSKSWSHRMVSNIVQGRQLLGEITTKDSAFTLTTIHNLSIVKLMPAPTMPSKAGGWVVAPQAKHVNLFAGVLYSANDDCPMHQYTTQSPRKVAATIVEKRYESAAARGNKKRACTASIKATKLEYMILVLLPQVELKRAKSIPRKQLTEQQQYLNREIEFVQKKIEDGADSARALNKPFWAS